MRSVARRILLRAVVLDDGDLLARNGAALAHPGAQVDLPGLQAAFNQRLARFKHPRRTLLLDAVPRTALGKVQKAALRALLLTQAPG